MKMQEWSSSSEPVAPLQYTAPRPRNVRAEIEQLQTTDQNFSFVLFEDFLYALYAEVHTARGRGQLARYSAFLTPAAAASFQGPPLREVRDIVIGAMTFTDARGTRSDAPMAVVRVHFETNYTEVFEGAGGAAAEHSYYAVEEWTLARKRGVQSRTPDRARLFACPSCGAPLDAVTSGVCAHCGKTAQSGDFDWVVQRADLVSRTPRGPMLTGDTQEEGTDAPTVVDPQAQASMLALVADDPTQGWSGFQGRVGLIFSEFQAAWSARDLAGMRPYMTDRLFEAQAFWVEAYRKQKLRNVTENARILGMELARVSRDRFFDAITVRVWATSLDYTLTDEGGRVVAGSKSRERKYSEYWTLIRSRGRKGATRTDRACPNCGAPLEINMAGVCKFCQAKVTTGDFDWVLTRIEQDEVYAG